jgi:co-chaperonin GroES (HSP10)
MTNDILPWRGVILCQEVEEETTASGLVLNVNPGEDPNKKPDKGIVVAVGEPEDPDKPFPYKLKAGDLVFYERYTKNVIRHGTKTYNFIYAKNIMGIIQK